MEKVEKILQNYDFNRSRIIQILIEVQKEFNYIPMECLQFISKKLNIPPSKIMSIATFYTTFSLEPQGRHQCMVCMGTACYIRGAPNVLNRIEERLKIKPGTTTKDHMFTLKTVNCLGACALAPIVVVDGNYNGQTTVQKVDAILGHLQKKSPPIK